MQKIYRKLVSLVLASALIMSGFCNFAAASVANDEDAMPITEFMYVICDETGNVCEEGIIPGSDAKLSFPSVTIANGHTVYFYQADGTPFAIWENRIALFTIGTDKTVQTLLQLHRFNPDGTLSAYATGVFERAVVSWRIEITMVGQYVPSIMNLSSDPVTFNRISFSF